MQKVDPQKTELIAPETTITIQKRQDEQNTELSKELSKELKKELRHIADSLTELQDKIILHAASLLLSMVLAGRRLSAAKRLLSHGEYTRWIEESFAGRISVRTAQRYTTLANFAESKMERLRDLMKDEIGGGVDELSDDQVLAKLPASKVFELIAYDKKLSKPRDQAQITGATLDPRFADAIRAYLGSPRLVLTSVALTEGEIESPDIVTNRDPAKGRTTWPKTIVAILANASNAEATCDAISAQFDAKVVKEALLLIPADQLDSLSLIELPQLLFTACHPFAANVGKISEIPMTLLLVSDSDRVSDFAAAFSSLGIVKVPFVPTSKSIEQESR